MLGVSAHYISTNLLQEIEDAGRDVTSQIYTLEPLEGPPDSSVIRRKGRDITSPDDGRKGASYVHSLLDDQGCEHAGPAGYMLIYSWGFSIGDIISSLQEFCKTQNLNPKQTFVWIDFLCINQHRVVEQKEHGGTGLLRFKDEFPKQIRQIGHILVMFSPWNDPLYLQRSWCIFEIFTAHDCGCKITIVMPPAEKEALMEDLFGDKGSFSGLYCALARTSVQNANASFEQDRVNILQMIQKGVGYHAMDNRVNELLQEWVHGVIDEIVQSYFNDPKGRELDQALSVADVMDRYGEFLRRAGKVDDSLTMFQKSKSLREAALGVDHLETARTYNNVGNALAAKKDHDAALLEFRKCLAIRIRELGTEHVKVAVVLRNIGISLREKGDYDGALVHWRRALPIVASNLGVDHPETNYTTFVIRSLLKAKGDYNDEEHRKNINEIFKGVDQSNTASNYLKRGKISLRNEEYDRALEDLHKALTIQVSILGSEHPDTADSYHMIGKVMNRKGNLEKALDYYRKSLTIREAVLANDHPDLTATRTEISRLRSR